MICVITGVTGMDGSIMSKKLLDRGDQVYGVVRQSSTPNYWRLSDQGVLSHPNFHLIEGDITDPIFIIHLVSSLKPDQFFNFAAQSQVGTSFNIPIATAKVDGIAPLLMLEAIRMYSPDTKFYTASTSEMFGNTGGMLNEQSRMDAVSPYAAAKLFAYQQVGIYRDSYGIFACSGILFNHTSKYRGEYFVEKKVGRYVAALNEGRVDGPLRLGNLRAVRDWGYAPEYMDGVLLMMNQDTPKDYVLATGQCFSIERMVRHAFSIIGVTDWRSHVVIDPAHFRPNELKFLLGDASQARNNLGWTPATNIFGIMEEIIEHESQYSLV